MANGFHLINGSQPLTTVYMQRLLVRLAVRGPLRWFLCGNHLDLQGVIYAVAQRANGDYYRVLENNIAIARAETCYQVVGLLHKSVPAQTPTLITDLLTSFYDDGVRDDEASELFNESLQALRKLSQGGPVAVSAASHDERPGFHAALAQSARRVISIQEEMVAMGHTTLPMTERFRTERSFFNGFNRALLNRKDQLLHREMWDSVEAYIPPAEKSTHPLLIATIHEAMILDQRKLIDSLQTQVEKLGHEFEATKKSKDEEIAQLERRY